MALQKPRHCKNLGFAKKDSTNVANAIKILSNTFNLTLSTIHKESEQLLVQLVKIFFIP